MALVVFQSLHSPLERIDAMDAKNTAVLLVHLEVDIVDEGGAFGPIFGGEATRRGVVDRARALADAARERGVTIVHVRIAYAADYSDLDPSMPLLQMVQDAKALRDGERGAELLIDQSVRGQDDVILTHRRPGPFTGSSLDSLLRSRGIQDVAVAGVATNVAVESTVRQAADLGYCCSVLADVCSAADPAAHDASLASMALFAQVTDTSAFLDALA